MEEGFGGGPGGGNAGKTINAKIEFESISTKEGEPIKATVSGKIVENKGGMFGGRRNNTPPPNRNFAGSSNRTIETLDANRDGELSVEEVKNATKALLRLDRNNDGKISRQELGSSGRGNTAGFRGGFGGGGFGNRSGGNPSTNRRPEFESDR